MTTTHIFIYYSHTIKEIFIYDSSIFLFISILPTKHQLQFDELFRTKAPQCPRILTSTFLFPGNYSRFFFAYCKIKQKTLVLCKKLALML